MTDTENTWDKLLQIKTTGRDDSHADQYHHPYEPTPYCVLERLANKGFIGKRDVVLDYGCGKGRVDFFLSYQTKAGTIGIEYDKRIYQSAVQNQKTAVSRARVELVPANAETYAVPAEVNRCYFFNPFFRGTPAQSDRKNQRILLRESARNPIVFLLSGRCIYFLSHDGR